MGLSALQISTWYWLALGLGLVFAELFLPGGILLWLGVGAALVGIVSIPFKLSLPVKLLIWAVSSGLLLLVWYRFFRDNDSTRDGRAEATLGYTGTLLRAVGPGEHGAIRFGRPILGEDVWECESEQRLTPGTTVKVVAAVGRQGRRVKVMRADLASAA